MERDDLFEERRFLLASLRDLDAELAAGDISEDDHRELRGGYVARLAAVVREIEGVAADRATDEPARRTGMLRRVLVSVCVFAVATGSGVFVARQSGQRIPGGTQTGGVELSTAGMLATARSLNFTDPARAIELYADVLKLDPDNVEALTYQSWLLALTAREAQGEVRDLALSTAIVNLMRAQDVDPTYPDAHCFLGIVYFRFLGDARLAKPQLDECLAKNPPAVVSSFVNAIVDQVNAAVER